MREGESFHERRREFPLERERFLTWASSQRGSPEGGFSGEGGDNRGRRGVAGEIGVSFTFTLFHVVFFWVVLRCSSC